MAEFHSKSEVKEALQKARADLKAARKIDKTSQESADLLKKCNDLQYILDRW